MQICQNCSHRNRPGVVFCDNCGASLIGDSPLSTKSIAGKMPDLVAETLPTSALGPAADVFSKGTILRIEVDGAEPLLLKPKEETVFGRRDPASGAMPDVDLTPFAGYRMGVSRRHAIIKQNNDDKLDLFDLGSSNGTFLNGTRLTPNKAYKLRDGDEIRFGQMAMKIHFQRITPENVPGNNTSGDNKTGS